MILKHGVGLTDHHAFQLRKNLLRHVEEGVVVRCEERTATVRIEQLLLDAGALEELPYLHSTKRIYKYFL